MTRGENIFKRKDGRWEARYVKGHDLSGKIKYGFCYGKTYKEAKEKVTKYKALIISGKNVASTNTRHRFAFYCDEWLRLRNVKIRESTYVKYESVLNKYIKVNLGSCFPTAITSELINDFARELLVKEKLSVKTVRDILSILNSVIKYTRAQFPGIFPDIEINYPKEIKKEMRVLTCEEQKGFVQYLLKDMDSCKFGLLLALFTGIRIGELCALRWEDISIDERTITIHATMQRLKNSNMDDEKRTKILIGSPKSGTSVRKIPMTEQLTDLCRKMKTEDATAYILTGNSGFIEPRTLQYRIKKYTQECGLEGVHCHTLRHTFATRAVEVGFEIKSLSEVLGHTTTTITLNRYVHSSMELKRANMSKLSAVGF